MILIARQVFETIQTVECLRIFTIILAPRNQRNMLKSILSYLFSSISHSIPMIHLNFDIVHRLRLYMFSVADGVQV